MYLTHEEWAGWVRNPVTKEFIRLIKERRREKLEQMASFTDSGTITKDYFHKKGECEGLLETIELMKDLKTEEKTQE